MHFVRDPPLMFWHISSILQLDYWLIPVPNSYWTIERMKVPIDEVVTVAAMALGSESLNIWNDWNQVRHTGSRFPFSVDIDRFCES